MPIADFDQYRQMLSCAKAGKYAYPAINVCNIETLTASIEAFAEAESDGIIQASTGAGQHASGGLQDMVLGATILAEAAHRIAARYDVLIALHTDHCHPKNLAPFLDPLIEISRERVDSGQKPLFNSHMFDGSELPLAENLDVSKKYMKQLAPLNMVLEVEIGVVGGEEDGHDTSGVAKEKLYTTPEDMVATYEALQPLGSYMLAATFGNVHGIYKPGNVKLTPEILQNGQVAVAETHNTERNPLFLVFHGGSGSPKEQIAETLDYGVIKMNVDTDTQYAFTKPIAEHVLAYQDVLFHSDDQVAEKKRFDPRKYLATAREGMKSRVIEAVKDLASEGKSLLK
ncbi:MAG TPA: class II fructose-bisphosphate aldolase [Candidatus Latescibacteria bacterium]|jgi:fructose-bisphosphate aldolase class II|nr:class II fructose-bisphosphate aldolase [Candidatus Latescibacterota bacterium]|tara:strand:+ start:510 stop:1535 length:1026 start_codon:yes stop_codon:yes gene_type:complete